MVVWNSVLLKITTILLGFVKQHFRFIFFHFRFLSLENNLYAQQE